MYEILLFGSIKSFVFWLPILIFHSDFANYVLIHCYQKQPQPITTYSDIALWKLIKSGEKQALAVIYERYVNVLYNYAVKICKDPDLIEDSIQDLFIDVWKYRKNLSDTDSVKYYLYFSLRTKIARHASTTSRLISEGIRWDDIKGLVSGSSEQELIESEQLTERARRLKKYLHNLSPRQYEAIVLRFYDEFSFDEIGKIMDMNPQSVRNLIQRGIVQLKQYSQLLISLLFFFVI